MSGRTGGVPLPRALRTLERDPRGYPIPFIVLRDKAGGPHFTINDGARVHQCVTRRLCAICGKRLDKAVWFVGGARCFLHPQGAFLDPPVHHDCGVYALRVCPFLAARTYARRIDARTLDPRQTPDDMVLVQDGDMQPDLPERFGFGCTAAYAVLPQVGFVVPAWEYVEFWKQGAPVNAPDELSGSFA